MGGFFITGTDTGAGKTVVTASLALALRRRGLRVGVMKPVETGCLREDDRLVPQDALFLLEASGCQAPLELVNPYALAEPLAPALAAEREGIRIELARLEACYRELARRYDMVLVEGAGGLLVPLTEQHTMLDLANGLGLPLVVVARNILGVINHTALTVAVARQHGAGVLGVVLNHPDPDSDLATQTNAAALRRWAGAPLLGEMPYVPNLDQGTLAACGEQLGIDQLL